MELSTRNPIYALQGQEGLVREFNNDSVQWTDIVGTYIANTAHPTFDERSATVLGTVGGSHGLLILENIHGQQNPVVFAQLNLSVGLSFRPRVYIAISKGAKGIGFWRNCRKSCKYEAFGDTVVFNSVDNLSWWDDFPNIRCEIDQLLPVIHQPHWTTWQLTSSSDSISFATRDYQGIGHLIVANEYNSEVTTTFTIVDLPYVAEYVADYFTGEIVTPISNSSFSVKLPAFGTAVYRLAKIAYSMWIHGHNLQVEYPQRGKVERKGFSAKYTSTGAAQPNWLHFAIPTPVIVNDKLSKVGSVLVRFKSQGQAYVKAIHVYDGEKKIAAKDNLKLSPKQWHVERIDLPATPQIQWGIGISILVDFGPDNRWIEISAVGCDFLQSIWE